MFQEINEAASASFGDDPIEINSGTPTVSSDFYDCTGYPPLRNSVKSRMKIRKCSWLHSQIKCDSFAVFLTLLLSHFIPWNGQTNFDEIVSGRGGYTRRHAIYI